jgi:RNA polymerase sigma-70 factor (ECF subfamily)
MEIQILESNNADVAIRQYRSKLLPYAYNILGDFMEAEDIVQEVLNRYYLNASDHIKKPYSYLVKSVINRSINQKKLLRSRKEQYLGEWLPTPVFTEEGIYSKADRNHILNYSLLVLLEHLNPKERAVFILKETFDFSHAEIAAILEVEIENSRQLLKRAKQKIDPRVSDSLATKNDNEALLRQLTDAILTADIEKVKDLLSADVRSVSDGGSKVRAARNILVGQERVYKLLKAVYTKYFPENSLTRFATVNHNPAILYLKDGVIYRCAIFEIRDNIFENIYIVVNPDKLQTLNFQS